MWRTRVIIHISTEIYSSSYLVSMQMKAMEENDEITFMIQELSKSFPTLSETLIRERDL